MRNFALLALIPLVPVALSQTIDPSLVAKLRAAPTHPDRISLLRDDQFVFNFLDGIGVSTGFSGRTIAANAGNFPALIGNGVAMSLGYLEGCGMNIPHTHPRATEINVAINGTLRTGMLAENGARFVFNDVPAGSATVFPQGAIHFEMNTECEPTLFVAGFNHEDPGASAVAQRLFGLPTDIVAASLNSLGVIEIAELESKLPNNVALGTEECIQRCGIQRGDQPTSQRQPRLPANQLPPGFSGPPPPPPMPTTTAPAGALDNSPPNGQSTPNTDSSTVNHAVTSVWRDKNVKSFLIALLVINGLFVLGSLTALFLYVARTRVVNRVPNRELLTAQFVPLNKEKALDYYDPYQPSSSPTVPESH